MKLQKFSQSYFKKPSVGMTVVEILVAMAIMGILAAMGATLTKMSVDATRFSDQKNELDSLAELIAEKLKFETTCRGTIGPTSGLNLQITSSVYDDNLSRSFNPTDANGGWEIPMVLPGIGAGTTMDQDVLNNSTNSLIMGRRLKIDNIRLADGVRYTVGTNTHYVASVYLSASDINGFKYKPVMISTVNISVDASSNIVTCSTAQSANPAEVCTSMGCNWNAGATPPCNCASEMSPCPQIGFYPVAYRNGIPDCRPLGGDDCSGSAYLVGIGIERTYCSDVPLTVLTTSTTVGAGPTTTTTTAPPTTTTTVGAGPTSTTVTTTTSTSTTMTTLPNSPGCSWVSEITSGQDPPNQCTLCSGGPTSSCIEVTEPGGSVRAATSEVDILTACTTTNQGAIATGYYCQNGATSTWSSAISTCTCNTTSTTVPASATPYYWKQDLFPPAPIPSYADCGWNLSTVDLRCSNLGQYCRSAFGSGSLGGLGGGAEMAYRCSNVESSPGVISEPACVSNGVHIQSSFCFHLPNTNMRCTGAGTGTCINRQLNAGEQMTNILACSGFSSITAPFCSSNSATCDMLITATCQ